MAPKEAVEKPTRKQRKGVYAEKLRKLIDEFKNVLVVTVDNVGSNQMQKVRIALRSVQGGAVVLMGKNTLIRKVIREKLPGRPELENLIPLVYGNVGFVFTNGNLGEVRKIVLENKVPAAAKSGSFAPEDVWVPAGPTGLDPGQTSFFQALNIATKIVKGTIEIVNNVHLIKKGDKVTISHVTLLNKINILPFFYGFGVTQVFENGTVYAASILDMSQDDLMAKFMAGVNKVAAISLAISYPNQASVSHFLNGAFKKLVCLALATDINFPLAKAFKDFDPSKVVAAAPAAAAAGGKKEEAKPAAKEEPEEESDVDMGGLFD